MTDICYWVSEEEISPQFKKNEMILSSERTLKHPFDSISVTNTWC